MVGSDLAGVVLKTGAGVHTWKPGDRVVAHCLSVELEEPDGHNDTMLDPEQRIWGFETNFGGLAEIALVKANQLMPKPDHLTWEEAASPGLVNCTAYRQLVSQERRRHEAGRQRPDLGRLRRPGRLRDAVRPQRRRHAGLRGLQRGEGRDRPPMGAELVINRSEEGYRFWKDEHTQDPKEWKRFGAKIRELTGGEDIDIVFEHPGRETFGASVFVTRKGGTITTCASTSGYMHEYDNRYLWMNLKRIISSHFANYRESWEANRLIAKGKIHPTLSRDLPPRATSARPRSTCTTTPTRARSACSAWPPRRASGSATRSCAPSTWTRSTGSAGSERRPDPLVAHGSSSARPRAPETAATGVAPCRRARAATLGARTHARPPCRAKEEPPDERAGTVHLRRQRADEDGRARG